VIFSTWRAQMRDNVRLGAILARGNPPTAGALALTVAMRSIAPLAFALTASFLLAELPRAVSEGLGSESGRRSIELLVMLSLAFAAQQIMPSIQQALSDGLGRKLNSLLDQRIMRVASAPPTIGHLESPEISSQLDAARRAATGWPRAGDAVSALSGRISARVAFYSGIVMVGSYSIWGGILLLITATAYGSQLTKAMIQAGESQVGQASALREASYICDLALDRGTTKEARVFGWTPWLIDRHRRASNAARNTRNSAQSHLFTMIHVTASVMSIAIISVVSMLGIDVSRGTTTLLYLALAIQGVGLVVRSVSDESALRDAMLLGYAGEAFRTVTELERSLHASQFALISKAIPDVPSCKDIHFQDVYFRYTPDGPHILQGMNLTIPANRTTGIVGLNGAGKTTLVKLLCGLYKPTAGKITIDGVDLADLDPNKWREHVSAIFQDYVRYPLSAADNVAAWTPSREHELQKVADVTGLHPILERLPDGWDTLLVPWLDGGVDLSGGQWQRVALCRALLKAQGGADVLILDEPTASLDAHGEAEIYETMLKATKGRTTILISHRLSSVRYADQIAVVEDGQIVEIGSHEELLARQGAYAELFGAQAKSYDDAGEG